MKKIFSILSLMLMFACCNVMFTSCGSDDEDEKTEDSIVRKLVGTWEYYEPGYPNTVHSMTLNADGTYYSFIKDIVFDPNSTETDKEGYLFKYKGTYTISNDKITFVAEYVYDPILLKDPNDAEWHRENVTFEASFELQKDNTVSQFKGFDDEGKPVTELWEKVL